MSLETENTSDFKRQGANGKATSNTQAVDENDVTPANMMEFEPLLEASGERNLRSINLTHGEYPCHCLAQVVWYPEQSNLCLIWDVEEIRSIGLPDHQQRVTLFVVSSMLALQWIEQNITNYWESKAPTVEAMNAIDYSRRLELFETACKVLAVPMEVRHVWSRIRFFSWFRATLTEQSQKEYRQFLAEIGPEAFKRSLLTGWKRVGKCLEIIPMQGS